MAPLLRNILLWLALILPFSLIAKGGAQPLYQYGLEAGLPSERVYWSLQDSLGYMWFATQAGLCRYDGYSPEVVTASSGLSHNDVRRLFEDKSGRLWMLTVTGMSRKTGSYYERLDSIKGIGPHRITSLMQSPAGPFWLTSISNIYCLEDDTVTTSLRPSRLGLMPNAELVRMDSLGTIWMADNHMLLKLSPQLEIMQQIPLQYTLFEGGDIAVFADLGGGTFLYAAREGVVLLEPDGRQKLVARASSLPVWGKVRYLKQDRQGDIWLSLEQGGLLWMYKKDDHYHLIDRLLPNESIWHTFDDREGNLWVSTDRSGVWLFTAGARSLYRYNFVEHQSLQRLQNSYGRDMVDLCTDAQGRLWLAWENGQLIRLDQLDTEVDAVYKLDLYSSIKQEVHVRQILGLQEGGIMIAADRGLFYFRNGTLTKIPAVSDPISISQLADGEIFVGANNFAGMRGMLDAFLASQNEDPAVVSGVEPFVALQANDVEQDYLGRIWIAWMGGVTRIDGNHETILREHDKIFRSGVNDLTFCSDSLSWIATNGSGLMIQKVDEPPLILDKALGMRNEVCNTICVDDSQKVAWVGTQNGMGWITEAHGDLPVHLRWLDRRDGLAGNWIKRILRYQQHLLILSDGGLTVMEPYYEFPYALPAPVYIKGVVINGEPASADLSARDLPSDSNNVELHFTGLGFRYPGELRFKYRLLGASDEWKETRETRIPFANLSSGDYTFEVLAVDRNGVESEQAARFLFQIRPPFYRSPWFISLMIFAVLGLGVLLTQFLQARRQKRYLEQRVNEKTVELQSKVHALAQANHDLKQFAYVASHDLKTPLRTIVNYLQLLERRYKSQLDSQADEYISFAVRSSKRLYEMINNLLHYSELGTKESKKEVLALQELADKVVSTLEGWLKERNARVSYDHLPEVMGVPVEWEILLRNLIENGIKFNYSERPEVRIEVKDSPGFWIMAVGDNGIGIPEEYQNQIFQLFQRLHTEEFPGSGLGLAMCKRIVEKQGGQIWLESKPGQGTQVIFSIPKNQPQTSQVASDM